MFVDFNRVFNNKPQTELRIPDAMVEHLNSNLPAGVRYKADENGNCVIVSEEGSINIGGMVLNPTEEHRKILGKNFTQDDILCYSYNAQKPIPIQLKKEGYITLNGQEFPIERLHYKPYNPVSYVSGTMHIYPKPFPEPFQLSVGCNDYTRQLNFKRVPNESVHVAAFESESKQPLTAQYFVDETNQTISFSISFNLSYAKTIRDVVEATSIYNAFADNKGLLMGQPLVANFDASKNKKYNTDSLFFWKKVLSLEETLGVNFNPPKDDVDFETMCEIEALYQNLIKKTPVKDDKKIDSLDGEWKEVNEEKLKSSIGEPVFFEFHATIRSTIFGIETELPGVVAIINSRMRDCSIKGKQYKIHLDHESEEKHMYTAIMRFLNEAQLYEYLNNSHNERFGDYHNSKTPQEYLKFK